MDIQVTGRHVPISDRFREHMQSKLGKIEQLASRDPRLDVVVSKDQGSHSDTATNVEITCHVKGPVIRAEARSDDKYAAFDAAATKLLDRLRKANDRRRVSRRRAARAEAIPDPDVTLPTPPPPAAAPTAEPSSGAGRTGAAPSSNGSRSGVGSGGQSGQSVPDADDGPDVRDVAGSPIEVRVKHHQSDPMNLEQALYEMEMVGHDFYLFTDSETGLPSVMYRRRGWSYGVLHLERASGGAVDVEEDVRVEAV